MKTHNAWTWLRVQVSRIADLGLRHRRDRRLAEEIDAHLVQLTDRYEANGLWPLLAVVPGR